MFEDLSGTGAIGGDDRQSVVPRLCDGESDLHSFVEIGGLAVLSAGIGGMILFVAGHALDLQERPFSLVLSSSERGGHLFKSRDGAALGVQVTDVLSNLP